MPDISPEQSDQSTKAKERGKTMRIKTNVKAGKLATNHNQAVHGLRVKRNVKAGGLQPNHNQTVTR